MGRRRIYQHYDVPGSVVSLVQAMIQDYPRRQRIIDCDGDISPELERLNEIICDTTNSHDPMLCSIILDDIINARGFEKSKATIISSKKLYYNMKRKIIQDIAIQCHLI